MSNNQTAATRMNIEEQQLFARKKRQRLIEYSILIAFQGFFATAFFRVTDHFLLLIIGILAFGLAWNLAQLREERRMLDLHNTKRLIGDALESLIVMFFLVFTLIISRLMDVPFISLMAYLSAALMMYFVGSLLGETLWMSRNVRTLTDDKQKNYLTNLNRSIFFPYNLAHLRQVMSSLFGRRHR